SVTGTSMSLVMADHMANSTSAPIDLTVFTDVWTITGERASTAPASTASRVRSLTMLMAGTPYLSANALSTISRNDTTAMVNLLVACCHGRSAGAHRAGGVSPTPW